MVSRWPFSWRTDECPPEVTSETWVAQGRGVVLRGSHGDAEEVTDAALVATGRDDFVEDAVLAQCEGRHPETSVDPDPVHRPGVPGREVVHEEMRVDRGGPPFGDAARGNRRLEA